MREPEDHVVDVMHRLADGAVTAGLLTAEERKLVHVVVCDPPTWARLDAAIDRESALMLESVR